MFLAAQRKDVRSLHVAAEGLACQRLQNLEVSKMDAGTDNPFITWGTFVIALYGVAQPYVVAEYRRRTRPRRVSIIETSWPEVGFSAFGPTIGLTGILRSQNIPSLVESMRLHIIRESDAMTYHMTPLLNRNRALSSAQVGGELLEGTLWIPFQIEQDSPQAYDIFLCDKAVRPSVSIMGEAS